ncbi:MAG TPA: amidohydrolase family protein [Burkholderiales bacterium]|nr:amidohydrolase family protein [Burkholderiales bacterium]
MIDTHAHVISTDERRYPRAPLGGKQSDWSRERPVSAEEMVAAMDAAGIEQTVLVQASTCYGHDNSYVADAVAAHPRRFIGVFSVDVLAPDAPQRMRQWLDRGLAGLRIFIAGHTTAQDARLDDPRAFAAWEYAIAARVPICVQLRAGALGQLQSMLARFPKARVLLDHMARPVVDDAAPLVGMAKYENLYLKLTTHNVRELPQSFFARVVKSYGAARIAWGSNYPAAAGTLGALLADAREALAAFSAAERDWIFSRTAKSFYAALA